MYPLNGFESHYIYDDFTIPTFDDKHNLIKGGSWASCGNCSSPFSRYAFRRHFYQHAGFRIAKSNEEALNKRFLSDKEDFEPKNLIITSNASYTNPYETDSLVNMYC